MNREDQARKAQQIITKARTDDGFKKRLLAEPAAVLKEGGVEIPPDVEVRMLEDTDKVWHLVLPPPLSTDELDEQQLDHVAGGAMIVDDGAPSSGQMVKGHHF
jgi:hypothetical protein